jgi:peptidoglycan/LPS O-acetylase OafA/YrhL
MASGVMLYHFSGGIHNAFGADDILGRLGIYAVSIFYVLSGLSLTIVYRDTLRSEADVISYALKRVFRIFPLFWAVVTVSVLLRYQVASITGTAYSPDLVMLILNYSLLFGFVRPEATPATGAWSIGNEMVFYTLFPFLLLAGRKSTLVLVSVCIPFFLAFAAFAFFILDPARPLSAQISTYVNPLNQAFLFVAGVLLGYFIKPRAGGPLLKSSLLLLVLGFCFFPAAGDLISIATGHERIVFSLLSIAFVGIVYASNLTTVHPIGRGMKFLGDISYSVYLIHPPVLVMLQIMALRAGMALTQTTTLAVLLAVGVPVTILASYLSYRFLEQPMMRKGGKLAAAASSRLGVRGEPR